MFTKLFLLEGNVTMISDVNQNADLVVIGGGGAGLAAALAAAEKGVKKVIVLEKRGLTGGTSAMASGIFGAESPAQKRQSIIADKDDLYKRVIDWALKSVNPRIIRDFINKSGDTVRWLEEKGIFFYCVPPIAFSGVNIPQDIIDVQFSIAVLKHFLVFPYRFIPFLLQIITSGQSL